MRRFPPASVVGVLLATAFGLAGCDGSQPTASLSVAVRKALPAHLPKVRGPSAKRPRPPRAEPVDVSWIPDPLFPERRIRVTGKRAPDVRGLAGSEPPQSQLAPIAANRIEKTPAERGGVDPCERPDPGYGSYTKWKFLSGFGKHIQPKRDPVNPQGDFDFIAHFHGADLARMEYVRGDAPIVFLAVDGANRGYPTMTGHHALDFLIHDMEHTMKRDSPTGQARAGHVALAAWSGGYAAIRTVLQQSEDWKRIDAIILLDGLHAPREVPPGTEHLPNFVKFARRAAAGEAFFFVSYSSIPTDGHASTTEATRLLLRELGKHPVRVEGEGPGGMELKEAYSARGLHTRGYKGGGRLDHCAHLLLYPEVAAALYRYWYPGAGRQGPTP